MTKCGKEGGSPRIMFVGNSTTRHEPNADIGWNFNHGMAASCAESDYVHLVMAAVLAERPDAEFCIVQASRWEFKYKECDIDAYFHTAKDFNPDLIITLLSGNIPAKDFTKEDFILEMGKLHAYLSGGKKVSMIQGTGFFGNETKNEAIKEYCRVSGAQLADISELCQDRETLAIGKFWHEGVAMHPGDKGMKKIADIIIEKIQKII